MDIKDAIFLLLTLLINGLLVCAPAVAIWRSFSRRLPERVAWLQAVLALIGPAIAAFVFFVLLWLPDYSGQCGGWLGETSPCSGFGQYATETMFWAAMGLAVPGVLGMLLGAAVLVFLLIRRRLSRPVV